MPPLSQCVDKAVYGACPPNYDRAPHLPLASRSAVIGLSLLLTVGLAVPGGSRGTASVREPVGSTFAVARAADRPFVYGSKVFQARIGQALDLLAERAPDAYARVSEHLTQIVAGDRSGAIVQTGTFVVAQPSWETDAIWLASIIVHDTIHVEQFKGGRSFTGRAAEAEAMQVQMGVLRQLGAAEEVLTYAAGVLERNYWEVPFEERNW